MRLNRPRASVWAVVCSALVGGAMTALALGQPPDAGSELPGTAAMAEGRAPGGEAAEGAERAASAALAGVLTRMSPQERSFFQHVTVLSSPFFEGRAPGTRGNELAAEYVEFHFRKLGLEPAFASEDRAADGTEVRTPFRSYRQAFAAGREQAVTRRRVALLPAEGGAAALELSPGADFNVLGMSGDGDAEGPLAFVGYSIVKGPGDQAYTSYPQGAEKVLEGRVALMFRFEPMDAEGRSKWRRTGPGWSAASALEGKLKAAVDRGAAAIILVNPPGAADARANRMDDHRTTRGVARLGVPVVMVSAERAGALVASTGKTLLELRQAADEAGGVVEAPGAVVRVEAGMERREIPGENVGAVLRGRGGLASEWIVVGAHMDHVGYGYFGSRAGERAAGTLHPGADDNASGTAGLLLSAEQIARAYRELPAGAEARSILFAAFNAEEGGLIGSRAMLRSSPVPVGSMYAMLNMDMIGRLRRDRVDAAGVGTAEGFEKLLEPIFAASGLEVRTLPGGRGPSDHANFYAAEVPVLHFFTGLHAAYHMPEDTFDTINPVGGAKVAALVGDVALALAARAGELKFTTSRGSSADLTDPDERADALPAGHGQPAAAAAPEGQAVRPMRVNVRFGIAPGDYADDKPGVLVGDVYKGTSADEAGVKVGDRITRWNDRQVRSVEDWMPLLAQAKPGDQVQITLVRGTEELRLPVTLKARDQPAE